MKASLKIEAIGDDSELLARYHAGRLSQVVGHRMARAFMGDIPHRSWCAEIIGSDARYGYQRRFLRCKKDYRNANSKGSRGVYKLFILDSGHIYEVSDPRSWRTIDRYFCTVSEDGEIVRMTQNEVDQWLRNNSGASRSE